MAAYLPYSGQDTQHYIFRKQDRAFPEPYSLEDTIYTRINVEAEEGYFLTLHFLLFSLRFLPSVRYSPKQFIHLLIHLLTIC